MDITLLKQALYASWNTDTAYKGVWDRTNPPLNQCAVTSLVIQDYLGGEILGSPMTNGGYHFWNLLSDGEQDFTADQFLHILYQPQREQKVLTSRSILLQNPNTLARYMLLKSRVNQFLSQYNQTP